jgi:hypothetical protein
VASIAVIVGPAMNVMVSIGSVNVIRPVLPPATACSRVS